MDFKEILFIGCPLINNERNSPFGNEILISSQQVDIHLLLVYGDQYVECSELSLSEYLINSEI